MWIDVLLISVGDLASVVVVVFKLSVHDLRLRRSQSVNMVKFNFKSSTVTTHQQSHYCLAPSLGLSFAVIRWIIDMS